MPYTLILLGSDTNFSPTHVEDVYDKAETLSYIATLIKGEPLPTDDITQFRNTNVAVVNGPRGLGAEIGDRIARGVQALLEAITRGEKQLCIIGHGRGALAGLLVAHELERIQKILKNPNTAHVELTNSESGFTHIAMNGPHNEAFAKLNFNSIVENIGDIKLAIFSIDPVSGAKYSSTPQAAFFLWRDARFYTIPQLVNEFEEYIYENERTSTLKAIIPRPASTKSHIKLMSLPGHYDTGSGNLKDQIRGANPTDKTTKHVQELIIVKLVDFLIRHNVDLRPTRPDKDPFSHLLAGLFENSVTESKLHHLYLDLYNNIVENKEGYQHFNNTAYPSIGQEQALYKQLWKKGENRIVHYLNHQDTHMSSLFYSKPDARFLNAEHARIYLNNELGLADGITLSETMTQVLDKLIDITKHHKKMSDLNNTVTEDEVSADEHFKLLLEGLSLLIEDVTGSYLQHEHLDNGDKIYIVVENAFTFFKRFTQREPDNEIAKTIYENLNTNLKSTLLRTLRTIEEGYKNLSIRMASKEFFNILQDKIHKITANLSANNIGREASDASLITQLNSFLIKSGKLFIVNPRVKEIRDFIEQEILLLNVIKVKSELATHSKKWTNLLFTEAIDDSYNFDTVTTIKQVIESYNKLDKFREMLPHFKVFNDTLAYDKWQLELLEKRDHMIHTFVQYVIKEKLNMEKEVKPLFQSAPALYKQIEGLSFGFGVDNPLTTELSDAKKQITALNEKITHFEKIIVEMKKENERVTEQLTTMKLDQEIQMYQLTQEKESLIQQLAANELKLDQGLAHFNQEKEHLTEQLTNSRLNHEKDLSKLNVTKEVIDTAARQEEASGVENSSEAGAT